MVLMIVGGCEVFVVHGVGDWGGCVVSVVPDDCGWSCGVCGAGCL